MYGWSQSDAQCLAALILGFQTPALYQIQDGLGYIPEKQPEAVQPKLKAIFCQSGRQKADQEVAAFVAKYKKIDPSAIACLQRDLEACLTFYSFPEKKWRLIRTTNAIERLFEEVKKRSYKMTSAFRNENGCTLLFYAVIRSLKLRRILIPAQIASQPENLHNT